MGSLVVAGGLLSCGMHVGSSSLTRDQTQASCIRSVESYPLRHQGSPYYCITLCGIKNIWHCKKLVILTASDAVWEPGVEERLIFCYIPFCTF